MTVDTSAPNSSDPPEFGQANAHAAGSVNTSRIGLFGGTFDPPHLGHLVAADQVRTQLGLDEVWFVVANDPWQKADREVSPAAVRLAMATAAVAGTPGFAVNDIEIGRGGPTYTVDTIDQLERLHPQVAWSVIVGSDAAAGLDTWERADRLAGMVDFIVVTRPGTPVEVPAGFAYRTVSIPLLDVSSSDLRRRIAAGSSTRFLMPEAVSSIIAGEGLYSRPE